MTGRIGSALRRGTLAGALLLGTITALALVEATPALAIPGPQYTISRFAGIENSAGGATPGPALSSKLSFVVADALDPAGNLYVVDPNNEAVEKITPDGSLSILAGTGQSGGPVAGPAASSTLNNPAGVASDAAGDIYIADQNNHVVEKVTPDGTLSVFAGIAGSAGLPTAGAATSSHLNQPDAIAVDHAGNVYIADFGNDAVEKVTAAGQLSVIAGVPGAAANPTPGPATSSHLSQADGVAVDAAGNVYIVDGGANVVAMVTPGGTLSIVAGVSGTSAQPTPGTATASALDDPNGVAVDAAGAVYVADPGANVIEKITAGGQLSVIAGNGTAGHPVYGGAATATSLDIPLALVVDPAGTIYVADALNFTIDRLTPPAPVSTAEPAITGTPHAGQTLGSDTGSWDNAPFTATYQWQDCDAGGASCAAIAGATTGTYVVTSADSGHTIRVAVTASNGGGSAVATSAQTAVVPDDAITVTPTPTTAPTGTPLALPVLATTTQPDPPTTRSATLTGEVSASTTPITVYFQYGTDASYGGTTLAQTLPASDVAQVVRVLLPDLIPGTVYHYHLVAGTGAATSVGQDVTLTTPKATLSRMRARITPERSGRFRLQGAVVPPAGVTRSVACRSGGTVTVTVTRNGKTLAARHVHVQLDCTYDGTIAFAGARLPARGHMQFHLGFAGNHQLNAHPAHIVEVAFGTR